MAFIPPEFTIQWATDGAAVKAKPPYATGTRYWNSGFLPDEVTADFTEYFNYVLEQSSAWSHFLARTLAPMNAQFNRVYTGTSPFGTSLTVLHLTYDSPADRWYCVAADGASNATVRLYQSDDGIAWSDAFTVTLPSSANDENITPLRSDGVTVGFAANGSFFESNDLDVDGIGATPTGASFSQIDEVRDLVYTGNRWVACGQNTGGTTQYIETSPNGNAWNVRETNVTGVDYVSVAHDGNGNLSCVSVTGGENQISSDDGITWTAGTASSSLAEVVWCNGSQRFMAPGAGNSMYASIDGDTWDDTGLDVDMFIATPTFSYLELNAGLDSQTGFVDAENLAIVSPFTEAGAANTDLTFLFLGQNTVQVSNGWGSDTTLESGQGKLVYTVGTDFELVYSLYGPNDI